MEHYALPAQVYGAGLVFARVGALVMLVPGVGEATVPPRLRLGFAFVFALVLYPVVRAGLPPVPATVGEIGAQVALELLVGLAIGSLLRLFLQTLSTAGEVVSIQTTLSFAQTTNPLMQQSTASLATFLSLLGLTLVFSTGLHQSFIAGVAHSFQLFPAGRGVPVRSFAAETVQVTGESFALGVQLAAPVIVFSLVFNLAAGFIGRAMPQFQVFFAAVPLQLLLSLSVFALGLSVTGLIWVDRFRSLADRFAGAG